MLSTNATDYELCFSYHPGRLERRQRCFILQGRPGTEACGAHFSGYGRTKTSALRDLKDEMRRSDLHAHADSILSKAYAAWEKQRQGQEKRDSASNT